jgi:hypothetical protein
VFGGKLRPGQGALSGGFGRLSAAGHRSSGHQGLLSSAIPVIGSLPGPEAATAG